MLYYFTTSMHFYNQKKRLKESEKSKLNPILLLFIRPIRLKNVCVCKEIQLWKKKKQNFYTSKGKYFQKMSRKGVNTEETPILTQILNYRQ